MYERGYGKSCLKLMANIFEHRFLPASLYIEAILRRTTLAGRGETLKLIKDGSGFGDAYGSTLVCIMTQDEEKATLAMAALRWICYSERPLQVDELCHALAVEIGATDFNLQNIPSIDTLLDYCQGLIVVDSETSTVRLIHYTVQEYLCSYPGLFSKPHSILAETCLTYLNSQYVKRLTPHSMPPPQSMSFLKYSARYWGTHTKKDLSDHAMALALELLSQYEDHISAVSLLKQVLHPSLRPATATSPLFSGLHCASFFGIVELVTVLIYDEGCEIDQQDCVGRTPLAWAAKNGHEAVVKALLEWKNIDLNSLGAHNRTPLAYAAFGGHAGVVKLLLEHENVDPDLQDMDGDGPLGCAAMKGYEEVVKLLLEREDIDPNRRNKEDRTPLGCAAIEGHEGVVKLLLERENVDPNIQDTDGDGPLACAAIKGHEGVVKLLLDQSDIDPNCRNKKDRTPLGCAVIEGHEGVVKLLLAREDVDPNLPDDDGDGPLGCAAIKGHKGVVKLLLAREDVDPNLPDDDGDGPLGCAALNGHEGVVKVLLEREDVDLNHRNKIGRTPLACAAFAGHEGVVKLLLERDDVDPNIKDKVLVTPLSYATWRGHEGIVQLLQARKSAETPGAGARREKKRDVLMRLVFSALD